jgi:hypothetical protein
MAFVPLPRSWRGVERAAAGALLVAGADADNIWEREREASYQPM